MKPDTGPTKAYHDFLKNYGESEADEFRSISIQNGLASPLLFESGADKLQGYPPKYNSPRALTMKEKECLESVLRLDRLMNIVYLSPSFRKCE